MVAGVSKIESLGLASKVVTLSGTLTSREIARRLQEEDGVEIAHNTVSRFLKDLREERAEQTKALVQDHMEQSLEHDLQLLDKLIQQEHEWFFSDDLKVSEKLLVARELRQTIETKLKYSGAGGNDQQQVITVKLPDFLADEETETGDC